MLTYHLEKSEGRTKTEKLYLAIREDIRKGILQADEKLPSKRDLAEHLGLSVITVENAYAMLSEEGYLSSKPRSGYYVNRLRAADLPHAVPENMQTGMHLLEETADTRAQNATSIPGYIHILRRILSERPEILLEKPPHFGAAALRNAIAAYLRRYRGMAVQPANIIIGSGAEYLYGLLVQLFGRNITYGIEFPSYPKIEQVYLANGAKVAHLKMGRDGIADSSLQRTKAKILHVTPFHSYPTNVTASAARRVAYITWARARDAVIIEDDFASEFSFSRKPLETLYAVDNGAHVIYMNTFSESLAPSIRIAYMVLPDRWLSLYREKLGFYSCTVPLLDQLALASFIDAGGFERQLARKRRAMRR